MAFTEERTETIRRFTRFYTRQIGLLQESLLRSPFTLSEARIIWEVAHRGTTTATELGEDLGLDAGYLSRLLRGLARKGILEKTPSPEDRRRVLLSLTSSGRAAFGEIDRASQEQVRALLARRTDAEQASLVAALETAQALMTPDEPSPGPSVVLRPPEPGDLGWVIQRHGRLYASEYGWDWTFEALAAEIMTAFVRNFDPARERCWIAERNGENVGCVFVVRRADDVAQLRCLLVDPSARGLGLGRQLVAECIRFARNAGYKRMMLWTNDILHAARRIYEDAGFHLVDEERHRSFGQDLVGQNWELVL